MIQHPLHHRLREATKALHHRLDHHPILSPLVRPGLTLGDYGDALAALHGPQWSMEGWVAQASAMLNVPILYAARLDHLGSDLSDLGRKPWPWEGRQVEISLPALVAMLYVLEGSRRGSVVIGELIRMRLPNAPHRFFSGQIEENSMDPIWRLADRFSSDMQAIAIEAAQQAFLSFLEHIEKIYCR